ncbi:Hypothetical predicted protein [Paramuricea clavata]|uniref:Uncharacterized protein n=1 Tax=Paramuricea clavata TaxID=317549 RepID=A0A7D9LH53_PARCT|nr:Hypothetical predicted protein [Paramuricea clavata]
MLSKLPNYLANKWGRIVDNRIGEDVNERSDDEDEVGMPQKIEGRNYPSFKEFSRFLKKEARIVCNAVISQCFLKGESNKKEVKESNYKQSRYRNVAEYYDQLSRRLYECQEKQCRSIDHYPYFHKEYRTPELER